MRYLRSQIWEILTCTAAGAGLALNLCAGFYLPEHLTAAWPLTIFIALAVTVLLTLAAYIKRTTLIGLGVGVLLVLCAVLWAREAEVLSAQGLSTHPLLYVLLAVLAPVLVFLAGRTQTGLIVCFLVGSVLIAAFWFLQYPVSLGGYLAFVAGTLLLYLQRVYSRSLMGSSSGRVRVGAYFSQSVLLVALAVALSAGFYAGVVRPLDPPTDELKLITRLLSLEVLEKLGVSSQTVITTPEQLSQLTQEEERTTQDEPEQPEQSEPQPTQTPDMPDEELSNPGSQSQDAQGISYRTPSLIPLVVLLVILLLAGPPCLKVWRKKRWYQKTMARPPQQAAAALYLRMLRGLSRAGVKREASLTLTEFVSSHQKDLEDFSVGGVDFPRLTALYEPLVYGNIQLEPSQLEEFAAVYRQFFKNLRKKMGIWKYLRHFYFL